MKHFFITQIFQNVLKEPECSAFRLFSEIVYRSGLFLKIFLSMNTETIASVTSETT